jgi:hypothetical protein
MVYQAYIDDSGSEPQSPIFILGGFIASHEQWAEFCSEWDQALKRPPALAYFKMTEAANLIGEFSREKDWTESKRDDRLITLARIIRKYAKVRVAALMPYDAFMRHISTIPASARTLSSDNPYCLLFLQTILAVATFGDGHGIDSACDFIFDEQVGFSDEVMRRWPQFKQILQTVPRGDIANFVGSPPIFRDEKKFLPLQAADLYAWQVRNYQASNTRVKNQTIMIPPSRVLGALEPIPEIYRPYSEAELARLRDHLLKIGEQFVREFPDASLIPLSDDRAERRRQRRRERKRTKEPSSSSVSPSDESPC